MDMLDLLGTEIKPNSTVAIISRTPSSAARLPWTVGPMIAAEDEDSSDTILLDFEGTTYRIYAHDDENGDPRFTAEVIRADYEHEGQPGFQFPCEILVVEAWS